MTEAKILRIYLDDIPRLTAERGNFNILNKIRAVFERHGFRVDLCRNTEAERLKSAARRGYSLFLMDEPFHPRALTMRKAYYYPFWRVEKTAKRWEFEIARTEFKPEEADPEEAARFCTIWRRNLFPDTQLGAPTDGTVYVPLQGRLLQHRSFQTMGPLDMIRAVLLHDPERDIVLSLHPGETYLPEELVALREITYANPRLRLSSEPMQTLLARCDYVATENSSVALSGFFLHKPAALFARIDFHHIAANVIDHGAEQAIPLAPDLRPDFDRYLHWFFKGTALNGGAPEVEDQVERLFRNHGWLA
ncbi:MAG: hypothetical protein GY717_07015 [Rhodobacteraceae bacterium]|nr:hypothetical protein [Paracoccaceae bacterium]